MTQAELRRLARVGAEVRLRELEREGQAILAAFPDLRSGRRAGTLTAVSSTSPKRRRRRMSREARKRIGQAQKKRWAELKAKQSAAEATRRSNSSPRGAAKKK